MTSLQFLEEVWRRNHGRALSTSGAPRPGEPPRGTLCGMDGIRIVDVTDAATFGLLPPCADPSFDHRTCDYWEDADRGSKAHRTSWLRTGEGPGPEAPRRGRPPSNPFLADLEARDDNPFALKRAAPVNPFVLDDEDDGAGRQSRSRRQGLASVRRPRRRAEARPARPRPGGLRELRQGAAPGRRGRRGEERPVAYAQFGPLSAYPRRSAPPRPVPAAPPGAAPRGDHVRRGHGRGPRTRSARAWSRRSARTSPAAASPPSRPTRRSGRLPTRPRPRRLRSGSGPASPSSSPTSATPSSAASSDSGRRDVASRRRERRAARQLDRRRAGRTIVHDRSYRWSYQPARAEREADAPYGAESVDKVSISLPPGLAARARDGGRDGRPRP